MPRIPKYRRHKASGRAIVQYKPFFGDKPHYLPGKFGSAESKEAYDRLLIQIVKDMAGHAKSKPSLQRPRRHGRVAQLLLGYLDFAQTYYGERSKSEFRQCQAASRIVNKVHGKTHLTDFGPLALKDCREAMIKEGWSRKYVNHQVNRVRRMFKWGVENEWLDPNVLAGLQAVAPLRAGRTDARELPPVRPVKWEHVAAVLPHLAPSVAAMVQLQWLTGMRSDEVTGMRGRELDMGGGVWVYRPTEHKTAWRGKHKVICLGPQAQMILIPFLKDDPDAYIFTPAASLRERATTRAAVRKTKDYSKIKRRRVRRTTDRYEAHSYQVAVNHGFRALAASMNGQARNKHGEGRKKREPLAEVLAKAGITYWHPHQIRHSRATLTRANYGIEGAQAQTGNTLDAAEIYAEKSLDLAMRIARETG